MKFRRRDGAVLIDCNQPEFPTYARDGIFVCKMPHSHQFVEECVNHLWRYAGPDPVPSHPDIFQAIMDEIPS